MLESIVHINSRKIFSLESANALLPLVLKITEEAFNEVKYHSNRLAALSNNDNADLKMQIEAEIQGIIAKWNLKVEKLGIVPNGLWIADFDSGDGYYCWKYPETRVSHYHGYQDGFSGRIKIE